MKKFNDPIEAALSQGKQGLLAGWKDGREDKVADPSRKWALVIILAIALVPLTLMLLSR